MIDRSVIVAMTPHEARMLVSVLDDHPRDTWAREVLEPVRVDILDGLKSLSKSRRALTDDGSWA